MKSPMDLPRPPRAYSSLRAETYLTALVHDLITLPITGTAMMLLLGVLHHEVSEAVTPVGFGPALIIGLLLNIITTSD